MKKRCFIEVNYHAHRGISDPEAVIQLHEPSNLFVPFLQDKASLILVKHMNYKGTIRKEPIQYQFFNRPNQFWQVPFATNRFIAACQPDLVLVQGLIFPIQVMALRRSLGKNVKILLQHQAEPPFKRKAIFQRMADQAVNGYLFSAMGLATPWLEKGIIRDPSKCFEMPPASTRFSPQDPATCRKLTGMDNRINYLWAGRLNANKDPLTVLSGFEDYFRSFPETRLYMVFQETDLLPEIEERISKSDLLRERVILAGKKTYTEMETWYNAADYIVSGSHHEGGSYALMEAMACGCVPIVTNIPASVKAVEGGELGYIFEKGNPASLSQVLRSLDHSLLPARSAACIGHFRMQISPQALARRLWKIAGFSETE